MQQWRLAGLALDSHADSSADAGEVDRMPKLSWHRQHHPEGTQAAEAEQAGAMTTDVADSVTRHSHHPLTYRTVGRGRKRVRAFSL